MTTDWRGDEYARERIAELDRECMRLVSARYDDGEHIDILTRELARARAVVEAARHYVIAMGECEYAGEPPYCKSSGCRYCQLARAVNDQREQR